MAGSKNKISKVRRLSKSRPTTIIPGYPERASSFKEASELIVFLISLINFFRQILLKYLPE